MTDKPKKKRVRALTDRQRRKLYQSFNTVVGLHYSYEPTAKEWKEIFAAMAEQEKRDGPIPF